MTKEWHEEGLYDAQRRQDGSKLAHEKLDGFMDKFQATLVDVEKHFKSLSSKKKKVIALFNMYRKKKDGRGSYENSSRNHKLQLFP